MSPMLLVTEPFPIRNSIGGHAFIVERFCRMLTQDSASDGMVACPDLRILCSAPIAQHIAGIMPEARPFMLQIPSEIQSKFFEQMRDWHTEGLNDWVKVRNGDETFTSLYEDMLRSAAARFSFGAIAYWGLNDSLKTAADRLGIPVLWAEYGPMREPFPVRFCIDSHGVNGRASSRGQARLIDTATVIADVTVSDVAGGDLSLLEASLLLPLAQPEPVTELLRFIRGKVRVVLLVLQLADDANMLAYGCGWSGLTLVEAALSQLERPDTVFVVRSHPGEALSFHNFQAGERVRNLVAERSDTLLFDATDGQSYLALLSAVTEVICINSSVGFEASMLGKPTRVLGEASYHPGPTDFKQPTQWLAEESVEQMLMEHFITDDVFWSADFWRRKAADISIQTGSDVGRSNVRLPIAAARILGPAKLLADGDLHVEGLGKLSQQSHDIEGRIDAITRVTHGSSEVFDLRGWGTDPATKGMLAGVLVVSGKRSVWCTTLSLRPDVAQHFGSPDLLSSGFAMKIACHDLPEAETASIFIVGITVSGGWVSLGREWRYNVEIASFQVVD